MSQSKQSKTIIGGLIILIGCWLAKKPLQLLIGIPLFLLGCWLAHNYYPHGYFMGLMLGLVGTYLVSGIFKCDVDGIEAILLGCPLYFLSMLPESYQWATWFSPNTIMVIRIITSFIGGIWIFSSPKK